jgi:hypothetical protein
MLHSLAEMAASLFIVGLVFLILALPHLLPQLLDWLARNKGRG